MNNKYRAVNNKDILIKRKKVVIDFEENRIVNKLLLLGQVLIDRTNCEEPITIYEIIKMSKTETKADRFESRFLFSFVLGPKTFFVKRLFL
jgi:hypothetical protein